MLEFENERTELVGKIEEMIRRKQYAALRDLLSPIEAADIVLMRDDIRLLPYLVVMSRRTLANIRVNIWASLLINSCAILLAATGCLGPAAGALVHNAGSLFVVMHAAMLLRCKPDVSAT